MQLKLLYMHFSVSAPFPGWCAPASTAPQGPNIGAFVPALEWWNPLPGGAGCSGGCVALFSFPSSL